MSHDILGRIGCGWVYIFLRSDVVLYVLPIKTRTIAIVLAAQMIVLALALLCLNY